MLPVSKAPLCRIPGRRVTIPSGKPSGTQGAACTRQHRPAPVTMLMIDARARLALEPLGFDDRLEELFDPLLSMGLQIGRVARVDRGSSYLLTADAPVRADTASHLHRDPKGLAPATVGDWVAFQVEDDGRAQIERILERTSVFTRGDPTRAGVSQILAANIDTVFLVHFLTRPLNVRRLEREFVLSLIHI